MRLLVIAQKVDLDDPFMGFFHNWIAKLAPLVSELHVVANGVGRHNLPPHVHVYSLGKEHGASRIVKVLKLSWHLMHLLPKTDGVFVHMCPEYVRVLHPINIFFKRPVAMWYAHVRTSPEAQWASEHVHKILSPSSDSFAFAPEKLVSTGHGIDTELFSPGPHRIIPEMRHIVSISRISTVKSVETLIEALRILVHEKGVTNIIADIYGGPARPEDDEYLASLKKKVTQFNIEKYVAWRGPVLNTEAVDVYRSADVFVRMQPGGGFGKTELEAMAVGVPAVLCTPVYKHLLGEFSDAMYYDDKNAEQFAEKLEGVLAWDVDRRAAYATVARTLVKEHHNLEHVAKCIVQALTV